MASKETPQLEPDVTTAFLVVQGLDGQWTTVYDYADREYTPLRDPSLDDIVGGCSNIMMSCQVQQTAVATTITMEQRAMQMQQMAQQQAEANRVASLIDPRKLRN